MGSWKQRESLPQNVITKVHLLLWGETLILIFYFISEMLETEKTGADIDAIQKS